MLLLRYVCRKAAGLAILWQLYNSCLLPGIAAICCMRPAACWIHTATLAVYGKVLHAASSTATASALCM